MTGNLLGIRIYLFYITSVGLSAKFIGIYPRSQVSVYRIIGPLVLPLTLICMC